MGESKKLDKETFDRIKQMQLKSEEFQRKAQRQPKRKVVNAPNGFINKQVCIACQKENGDHSQMEARRCLYLASVAFINLSKSVDDRSRSPLKD
uniref:Uncharacterized protein n=1 Tax=Nitrosopumivirus cobalaminus TaxID=3158414 RepID=A0AAU7N479_9VIRU